SSVVGDAALIALMRAIVDRDQTRTAALLDRQRALVSASVQLAETEWFFTELHHQIYRGDTALHVAAAAFEPTIIRDVVRRGGDVSAENRRGSQPLHYAVDGAPGTARWNPVAQRQTVECLLELGANP